MTGSPLSRRSDDPVRLAAASIARDRGCSDAAWLIEVGHRFPRRMSAMKPVERRAWAALVSAQRSV